MKNKHNLVRLGEWELTCITYKLMGEPKPLEVINGVLVKNEREQRRVEEYLKELYEFQSDEDYQGFLEDFIIRDNSRDGKAESKSKNKKGKKMKPETEWVDLKKTKEKVSMEEIFERYELLRDVKKRKG